MGGLAFERQVKLTGIPVLIDNFPARTAIKRIGEIGMQGFYVEGLGAEQANFLVGDENDFDGAVFDFGMRGQNLHGVHDFGNR
ncbi:hypothetical protein D3C80_1900390 [compost metagenome]